MTYEIVYAHDRLLAVDENYVEINFTEELQNFYVFSINISLT